MLEYSERSQRLLLDLEKDVSSSGKSTAPNTRQLYQIGWVLYNTNMEKDATLSAAFERLVEAIPSSSLKQRMSLLTKAIQTVPDKQEAIPSLKGLYGNSARICQSGWSLELLATIASMYDSESSSSNKSDLKDIASCLIRRGLLRPLAPIESSETHLQQVMQAIQTIEEHSDTLLRDLQQISQKGTPTLQDEIRSLFPKDEHGDYVLNMLQSAMTPRNDPLVPDKKAPPPTKQPPRVIRDQDPMQRRIQEVRSVLPGLGEGFVETALSYYQGNVNQTIDALLDESSLPATLRVLDRSLPARRKESSGLELNEEDRDIAKSKIMEMEKQEEQEVNALYWHSQQQQFENEYNDDYDDQYDDAFDGGVADAGLYDDYDQVMEFNRAARKAEAEESFWEEMKNVNHVKKNTTAGDGGNFRSLDKGKGGRPIGPDGKYLPRQKNPKKLKEQQQKDEAKGTGEQQQQAGKKKNFKPKKLKSHHQKERAQKKAARGMQG